MNTILELIRFGVKVIGIETESFLNSNTEEFTNVEYDELSGFHIIEGFNITECESFLLVSKDLFQNLDGLNRSSKTTEYNIETEKYGGSPVLIDNEHPLTQPKFCHFKSVQAHAYDRPGANTCNTPTKNSGNSFLEQIENEEFFISSLFDDTNEQSLEYSTNIWKGKFESTSARELSTEYIQDISKTPQLRYKPNIENDPIYFTPNELSAYSDRICLNCDFNKSDILLLLRLHRKKLALLENQLKKDLKDTTS
ncbi:hypothetical protein OJ253_646 [Cryptosporidium canis]|uniref:Uncharacterized protein n=1 Tax=Cryptosporidium canis TaxID=195482 RepID=A0A9D5DMU9_9CRYT|nr:hypothetical protein OJ253_646 [Cryptosporidium canis]